MTKPPNETEAKIEKLKAAYPKLDYPLCFGAYLEMSKDQFKEHYFGGGEMSEAIFNETRDQCLFLAELMNTISE